MIELYPMQGIQDERDDNVDSSLAPQVGPPGKMSLLLEALTHASSTMGSEDHFEIDGHVGKVSLNNNIRLLLNLHKDRG